VSETRGPIWRTRIGAWFFEGALPERPRVLLWMALGSRILGLAGLRFHRDRGQEKAGSLAYATLLALLPFVVLALSLVEFLAPEEQMDLARKFVGMVFPAEAHELRDGVLDYIERSREALRGGAAAGAGLRIAGAVLLLYFAANLVTGVDRVVGDIWGTGSIKAFFRRLTAYWAVGTIGPVLLALSLVGTTMLKSSLGGSAGVLVTSVLPFLVTWLSAFAFFRLMPHTGAKSSAAMTGALVAGTLWEATKLGMGWYLSMPRTLLTALSFFPAAILWMYISWAIAIYGMEITYVVHHGSWRAGRRAGRRELTGRARDELVVGVAAIVAREFDAGRLPDRARLSEMLCAGEDDVMHALQVLVAAGLVAADDAGGFRPARGAAGIPAVDVVDAGRGTSSGADLPAAAREFLARLDAGGRSAVADVSLQDLAPRSPRGS
jgi:membrane protein